MKNPCNYNDLNELVCQLADMFSNDEIPEQLSLGSWELKTSLHQSENGNAILSMALHHDGEPYLLLVSPDREAELYSFTVSLMKNHLAAKETASAICYLMRNFDAGYILNAREFQTNNSVLHSHELGNAKIPFNDSDFQELRLCDKDDPDLDYAGLTLCGIQLTETATIHPYGMFSYSSVDEASMLLSASQAEAKLEELLQDHDVSCRVLNSRGADYPVENGKIITSDYWQRKYHFEYPLPDGNIYHGFININAPSEDQLPDISEVKGTFWAERKPEGWYGDFELDGIEKNCDGVITTGIYRPETPAAPLMTRTSVDAILKSTQSVRYDTVPRFEGRLDDHLTTAETHHWQHAYKSLISIPSKNEQMER